MALDLLRITNVRNIASAELRPAATLNLLIGPNGSGKTSVLEAIYLLGRGKSFRGHQMAHVVRHGAEELQVFGRADGKGIGLAYSQGEWRLRAGGHTLAGRAELAATLPVTYIGPDTYKLFTGGPKERRQFLDWGLFHVEPSFLPTWRRYARALQQRNAALRVAAYRSQGEGVWDEELAAAGEALNTLRLEYVAALRPWLETYSEALLGNRVMELTYSRGWSQQEALLAALQKGLQGDREQGHTRAGPHRADMGLAWKGLSVKDELSRGQQKLFLYALYLAQLHHFMERAGQTCLLLLDDLTSELDAGHRRRVFGLLAGLPVQIYVTSTEEEAGVDPEMACQAAMFHVEHGAVRTAGSPP